MFIAIHVPLRRKPEMWILTLGWPVFYALLLGSTAYGMASVLRKGGPYAGFIPQRFRPVFTRVYSFGAHFALVAFPVIALAMGVAVLVFIS